mmetsp:Transcript_6102/g.8907  ORF Transcript_6102/g.8907 Transcript_6102/m.8907 type:complete len:187 (-) Transcript_6102:310-870(-)
MIGKLQNIATKRPLTNHSPQEPVQHNPIQSVQQSSYAARASMYTSTTRTSDIGTPGRQDTVQTTTSVTVIEQHEQRFVRIESMCQENATRINKMERTTEKTSTMLKTLLRHNGIAVDDDEDDMPPPMDPPTNNLNLTGTAQMEIENMGMIQGLASGSTGGNKRGRHTDSQIENHEEGPNSQNAQQA